MMFKIQSGFLSYFFSITLLAMLMICNGGHAQTNAYDIGWNPNQESDMDGYHIWVYDGPDPAQAQISDFQYIGYFDHDSLVAIYGSNPTDVIWLVDIWPSEENGEFVVAAARSQDTSGNQSIEYAFSAPFGKNDLIPPANVAGLRWNR